MLISESFLLAAAEVYRRERLNGEAGSASPLQAEAGFFIHSWGRC